MSDPALPTPGQDPWGEDLNSYLTWLESRLDTLEAGATALDTRIDTLEDKPEYIYNSDSWQFSDQPPPATGNQVRLNNVQGALATVADFRKIANDGADRTPWFQMLNVGSFIRIQDWDNAAVYYRYQVTAPVTIGATNVQVPIVWKAGTGVIPNAKCNVGFLVSFDPGDWS